MAELPRYRRIGITLAPQPRFDYADTREQARLGNTIAHQVKRMSDLLYKKQVREAEQRGKELVGEQGTQVILDKIKAKGGPKTALEISAYETANRVAAVEVESKAKTEIERILLDAETNKTAPDVVRERLADVQDGFAASLSNLDPVLAGTLRAKLGVLNVDAELRYSSFFTKYDIARKKDNLLSILAQDHQDIRLHAASEHATADSVETKIEDMAQKMRDVGFEPDDIFRQTSAVRKSARIDGTIAQFQRLPTIADKQEFLQDLQDNPLRELGVEGTTNLIRRLRSDLNSAIRSRKGEIKDLNADIKEANKILTKGGDPGQKVLNDLGTQAKLLDDEKTTNNFANLIFKTNAILSMRKMAPDELQEELNKLAPGIEGIGGEGRDTELEVNLYNSGQELLTNMKTELKKDPISYAVRTGLVTFSPLDMSSPDAAMQSVSERRQMARRVSNHYGQDIRFLTDEETKLFANDFENGSFQEQKQLIATISLSFGADAKEVFKQIAPKQPGLAHVGGLFVMGRPDAADFALKGLEYNNQGRGLVAEELQAKSVTGRTMVQINSQFLGDAFAHQSEAVKSTADVAMLIYTGFVRDRNIVEFDEDLYASSLQIATGFDDATGLGGIQEMSGRPGDPMVMMPTNMDADMVEDLMESVTSSAIMAATGAPVNPDKMSDVNDDYYPMYYDNGLYMLVTGKMNEPDTFRRLADINGDLVLVNLDALAQAIRAEQTLEETEVEQAIEGVEPGSAITRDVVEQNLIGTRSREPDIIVTGDDDDLASAEAELKSLSATALGRAPTRDEVKRRNELRDLIRKLRGQ